MRKILFLLCTCCIFLFCIGCSRPVLPSDIAGTWKAENSPWKVTLTPDGKVSTATIAMAEVDIRPNKTTEVEMKDGSISTFKAGDCNVEYVPESRELTVDIEMESIHVVFLDNLIEGSSKNIFVGNVSKDGETWEVMFYEFFDYGPKFPMDVDGLGEPMVFKKIK